MENRAWWTTEGIYPRCESCVSHPYYVGLSPDKPNETFPSLEVGMRAEYQSKLADTPRLYLSAVDRKLHLYRAEKGVWNIDDRESVNYRSLGGRFIDQWEHTLNGAVAETLSQVADRLIYSDSGGIQIGRAPADPAIFYARPPTDGAEWRALGEQLKVARKRGDGSDLRRLFDDVTQERVSIPDATMWDLRATDQGFRFLLALRSDQSIDALGGQLAAGSYLVTYAPGRGYQARPASPPRVVVSALQLRGEPPAELSPTRFSVELHNEGDEDARQVPIAFFAGRPGQAGQIVSWSLVDVAAGSTRAAETIWIPSGSGEWELRAAALSSYGTSSPSQTIRAAPSAATDVGSILLAQGLRPFAGGAISASLTMVVAIAVGLGFVIWALPPALRRGGSHR